MFHKRIFHCLDPPEHKPRLTIFLHTPCFETCPSSHSYSFTKSIHLCPQFTKTELDPNDGRKEDCDRHLHSRMPPLDEEQQTAKMKHVKFKEIDNNA